MKIKPPRGIYVHIPFCVSKCYYCSFYSLAEKSSGLKLKYITQLCREIRQTAKCFPEAGETLQTLYIGGGTPTVLDTQSIRKVVDTVNESFGIDVKSLEECTIEANPATVDGQKLKILREMGFNRLSLGIQSLNDNLLGGIGRAHDSREALRALDDARAAGFSNISADVIFGLPGQSLGDVTDTVSTLIDIPAVKHISAYSLTIEENTPFGERHRRGELELPDEDLEREMQYTLDRLLSGAGMRRYEISNYAYPGFESRHNTLYWKLDGYFGFGPGAAAFVNAKRVQNLPDISSYTEDSLTAPREVHALDDFEAKGDFMFLGLRMMEGVRDSEYRSLFGSSFFEDFGEEINRCLNRGLLNREGEKIALTPLGRDLANQVFMEFV